MAVLTLNPVFHSIKGRIGNIMLYNNNGILYARVKARIVNPDTEKQRIVRRTFGDAVRSWQSLTLEERQRYNKKARRLPINGYNYYISVYMNNNLAQKVLKENNRRLYLASIKPSSGGTKALPSVAGTFSAQDCLFEPYRQVFGCPGIG